MSTLRELLSRLDLGKSVAEFDEDLESYFVETEAFDRLVDGRADIVAGDKGTGKTALYSILRKRFGSIEALKKVEILPAFNPAGNPIFQQLAEREILDEGEYVKLWKAYILSLAGNWLLSIWEGFWTPEMKKLDYLLRGLDLRDSNDTPPHIFQKTLGRLNRLLDWKSVEFAAEAGLGGISVTPKVEFGDGSSVSDTSPMKVSIEKALRLLNNCLVDADITVWLAFDRLDEAFQGYPEIEVRALRALFRTYLDVLEFDRVKLKLFVRRDLFKRVTEGGFVNLTHVGARKFEIVWDEEDLQSLLCRRIRKNTAFCDEIKAAGLSDNELFSRIFPDQVDQGLRKPRTWTWMMRRIRDGQDIKPPRNLIDLVSLSQQAQLRTENRQTTEYSPARPVIAAEAIRKGLTELSTTRVNDTLLAEARMFAPMIEQFRGGKAEHNEASLSLIFESPPRDHEAAREAASRVRLSRGGVGNVQNPQPLPRRFGRDARQGISVEYRRGRRGRRLNSRRPLVWGLGGAGSDPVAPTIFPLIL